jgi:hypothetical protein
MNAIYLGYLCRVSDPHLFNADRDPAFQLSADTDPAFRFNADPNAAPHQGDANPRPLTVEQKWY